MQCNPPVSPPLGRYSTDLHNSQRSVSKIRGAYGDYAGAEDSSKNIGGSYRADVHVFARAPNDHRGSVHSQRQISSQGYIRQDTQWSTKRYVTGTVEVIPATMLRMMQVVEILVRSYTAERPDCWFRVEDGSGWTYSTATDEEKEVLRILQGKPRFSH